MANQRKGRHAASRAETNVSPTESDPTPAGRRKRSSVLSAAPGLIGVATVVLAATGAVMVAGDKVPTQIAAADPPKGAVYAGSISGSSVVSTASTTADRERAVSRDSQREALQDAADEKLQEAAESQDKERNAALSQLAASAEQHAAKLTSNAWSLPLSSYSLTATFGETSSLWSTTHTGLDFAAPSGTPIAAVAGGVVTSTEYDSSYGNKTVVTDDDGTEIWYCHQTSFSVSPGDQVSSGQAIGVVGATGNVTGPHLHLEVRPGAGDPVDPFTALTVHGLSP